MSTIKKLGIWMDHSSANVMEFTKDSIKTIIINSKFTHQEKEHTLSKNENLMHNKEQHQQADYYKSLAEVIRNYHEVVLFGPTSAKAELHNLIKADHNFKDINVVVKAADKMTENQQYAFVKDYFSKEILH